MRSRSRSRSPRASRLSRSRSRSRSRSPPRGSPLWRYVDGALVGPHPVPPLPPVLSVHAADFGARPEHGIAEVDQECRRVRLGERWLPHPWHEEVVEYPFYLREWQGDGWYAVYTRECSRFVLSHVHVDRWARITS